MEYKRAFCFGCSWTHYNWPTWADILEKDLDIPVQNWGIGGLGNVGIFCRMVQCNIINKFTDEDLIIVLWSGWTREDRYLNGRWHNMGNVHKQTNDSIYDSNFIDKFWDWGNDIIKNSTAIISANKMFPIFKNFSIIPMNSPEDIIIAKGNWAENEMIEFYFKDFPKIKQFNKPKPKSKIYNLSHSEIHPDIIAHSNFVKDEIYSKLNITMKSTTEKDVQSYQNAILKKLTKETVEKGGKLTVSGRYNIADSLWESNNWKKYPHHDWCSSNITAKYTI